MIDVVWWLWGSIIFFLPAGQHHAAGRWPDLYESKSFRAVPCSPDLDFRQCTGIASMKTRIKNVGKALIDRVASRIEARLSTSAVDPRTTPATKIGQLQLWHHYRTLIEAGRAPKLCETGFRCFSQFEEDGLILFIMAALGIQQGVFLDIGSGDGVNSNCANLAINFGWRGTFIDGNEQNITNGRAFYARHADTWAYPSVFVCAMITRENINQLLTESSILPEIDFMSIDIDGNDYWIWDAISVTSPKVVIIETHVEFGMNNIVVPYNKDYVYLANTRIITALRPLLWNDLREERAIAS
jgi:hypothetical protein